VIKPGTLVNQVAPHEDMLPTLLARSAILTSLPSCGRPPAEDKTSRSTWTAYNLLPYFKGESREWRARSPLLSDDGDLMALRYENWKAVFEEQRAEGFTGVGRALHQAASALLFNLRSDPSRKPSTTPRTMSTGTPDVSSCCGSGIRRQWISSFKEFPPRRSRPASA